MFCAVKSAAISWIFEVCTLKSAEISRGFVLCATENAAPKTEPRRHAQEERVLESGCPKRRGPQKGVCPKGVTRPRTLYIATT